MQPWSAFYWADYVADTARLSLAEHGAYMLLMAHYYTTGEPLPANAAILNRVCRAYTDAEQEAIAVVLTAYFRRDGDVYRHNRIDAELCKAESIGKAYRKQRESRLKALSPERRKSIAKAAAEARWGQKEEIKDLDANHAFVNAFSDAIPHASEMLSDASYPQPQLHRDIHTKKESKPSLEEVRLYCNERQNQVDPEKWFDFYQSKGWYVGKNKMRDWRAAVRTWEKNGFGGPFDDGHKTPAQLRNERQSALIDRVFSEEQGT